MNNGGVQVVRAGWLYRQSSFLHRWKKSWFTLSADGLLRYFDSHSQDSREAKKVYILRNDCVCIRSGSKIECSSPPDEVYNSKGCLFGLEMRSGQYLMLCAETPDDMKAWEIVLEDARTSPAPNLAPGQPPIIQIAAPPCHRTCNHRCCSHGFGGHGHRRYGCGYGHNGLETSMHHVPAYPGHVVSPPGSYAVQTGQVVQGTTVIAPGMVGQYANVVTPPYGPSAGTVFMPLQHRW